MAQDGMISKSEILERTGITYGQFYRWKRMGLIPETWFHRQSTFTGQETFLPRAKVLERIDRINDLKADHSLDEIAAMLSPDLVRKTYPIAEVEEMDWLSKQAVHLFRGVRSGAGTFAFDELVFIGVVGRLQDRGDLVQEQIALAARCLLASFEALGAAGDRHLTVARRNSVSNTVLHSGRCYFDPGTEILATVDLDGVVEDVKLNLEGKPQD
jgi:hypothetical protein